MNFIARQIAVVGIALAAAAFPGCDQLFEKSARDVIGNADKKAAAGDFRAAIKLYEASLDGSLKTADVHYKLALIYDDKLKSPLDALHHIDRYLELAPSGPHAKESRAFRKEAELRLISSLTKGTPITQEDAVRIRNENQSLRKQLVELHARKALPPATMNAKGEPKQKPIPPGARTHVVKSGETLGSIAQRYYKNRGRWKGIQDANFNSLAGTAKIKPGMTLIIP